VACSLILRGEKIALIAPLRYATLIQTDRSHQWPTASELASSPLILKAHILDYEIPCARMISRTDDDQCAWQQVT